MASLGTTLAFPLFFIGFLFARSFSVLMDVGIIFFTGALFFQLVTLPVELNASSRGLKLLTERGYLIGKESSMAREVLRAAALTYIAAAAMAVTQLLRLLVLRGMRD